MTNLRSRASLALTLAVCLAPLARSQATTNELQKIVTSDGLFLDNHGRDVDIVGDSALISTFADDDSGSARMYRHVAGSWIEEQKLQAGDGSPGDGFGFSAALVADNALFGAPNDDDNALLSSGSVYSYTYSGGSWSFEAKLHPNDPAEDADFGFSMAAKDDLLIVGAPGDSTLVTDMGAVYVFRRVAGAWVEEQKLAVSTPGENDRFGWNVATDGARIVASSIEDDEVVTDSGSVYVFVWNGSSFVEEQRLLAGDATVGDWFGWSVAVDGERIVVGANHQSSNFFDGGAIYAFELDAGAWSEIQRFEPVGVHDYQAFGWSLALQGDRLIVGSPGFTNASGSRGAAYMLHYDGLRWVEVHRWLATDGPDAGIFGDNLGLSVALDGDRVLAGSPWAGGVSAIDAGAAYSFQPTELALDAIPDDVTVGGPLELRTYGGLAAAPMGLFVTAIGGSPNFIFLGNGVFDLEGHQSFNLSAPPVLAGLTISFATFGFWQPTEYDFSNIVTVSVH